MAKAGKFAFPEFIHTDISASRPKGDPWVAARVQAVSSAFLRGPSLESARVSPQGPWDLPHCSLWGRPGAAVAQPPTPVLAGAAE